MPYYPMMVQLRQKHCLVVGGGQIAERKIGSLIAAGADDVRVVSPSVTDMIIAWERSGQVMIHHRPFEPADVQAAVIVIAATNDSAVNHAVYNACLPHQWINIVDRPDLCSFTVPSLVERGDLQIAISTGGHNPGLAKKLRRQLEQWIGPEYEAYTLFLGEMRRQVRALDLHEKDKRAILSELLDDRFLHWTKTGETRRRDLEAELLLTKRKS
ncbi:precorrin-2 dehydrogenase [Brevibacillus reuszeri]|uniref:precorrin-2 dehydrogenase n=1 Tax=Brevibacillus reuszeri TaxID=54915 RepID=A0A0K9YX94_9BACL|nr:bifunctional precorrin-2 dehydrogenase/sirohydrochlorin ferrochelatase [Brevibacillus reuszeri]KNB73267.1 potassium transporter Trk [Brevibacillus reuszeri]MED1856879.1 bifunctional precorrin-2 dehydrogenase/sirohydrochlorin ferrochelatase [Brevibacillus reuszeri]GED68371.1 precorrin-2 dehydrogenase [Brevibacillus reuszeri]